MVLCSNVRTLPRHLAETTVHDLTGGPQEHVLRTCERRARSLVLELHRRRLWGACPGRYLRRDGIDPARGRRSVLLDVDFRSSEIEAISRVDSGLANLDGICCAAY